MTSNRYDIIDNIVCCENIVVGSCADRSLYFILQ